jgi:uncharacterized protein (DUF1778 family)
MPARNPRADPTLASFRELIGAADAVYRMNRVNLYGTMPYNESAMKSAPSTPARLEARLPNAVLTRLKRAAEIQGRTLTDFVVAAADAAACRAIEQTEIIRLSIDDQRQIVKALSNPPKPTLALKRAFRRRRQLLGA